MYVSKTCSVSNQPVTTNPTTNQETKEKTVFALVDFVAPRYLSPMQDHVQKRTEKIKIHLFIVRNNSIYPTDLTPCYLLHRSLEEPTLDP